MPNPFTQFILMFYLSVMWTVAIFTIWVGQTIYFGIGSVVFVLIVVGGFFITALTFIDAQKNTCGLKEQIYPNHKTGDAYEDFR